MSNKSTTNYLGSGLAFLSFLLLMYSPLFGQQLELGPPSMATPYPTGPTTSAQTATFKLNTNQSNTFSSYTNPTTTVTVSISNQQYTSANYPGSPYPGLTFGADQNKGSISTLSSHPTFSTIDVIGSPSDDMFTSLPSGPSSTMEVDQNHAFRLFTDAYYQHQQYGNNPGTGGMQARNHYADVTITFNHPVSQPILHFAGFGGAYHKKTDGDEQIHGYFTELELLTTGITLSRLDGSTRFAVTGSGTKIVNTSTAPMPEDYDDTKYASSQQFGSSGSVLVNTGSTPITSITFRVFLRGMNSWSEDPSDSPHAWAGYVAEGRVGDVWTISASLPQVPAPLLNLSGNVFNDANGLKNSRVDGTPLTPALIAANTLYANLVSGGVVVASVPVSSTGTYAFTGVDPGSYTVILSTNSTSTIPGLPGGWVNTGENIGLPANTGNDNSPNGILAVVLTNADITNANFGIERPPVADPKEFLDVPGAQFTESDIAGYKGISAASTALTGYPQGGSLTGSDAEDCAAAGSCHSGKTFVVETINANTQVYYNGSPVIPGVEIPNFDKTKLVIYGAIGSGTVASPFGFTYTLVDAAGVKSSPVIYKITTGTALPVVLSSLNVHKEGSVVNIAWTTTQEANSDYFEVQHSLDAKKWTLLEKINSHGDSKDLNHYDYTHSTPSSGTNYYRLAMVDHDKSIAYSIIRNVNFDVSIEVYPNPTSNYLKAEGSQGIAHVYTSDGILKFSPVVRNEEIDISKLTPGVYLVDLGVKGGGRVTKRFVVSR